MRVLILIICVKVYRHSLASDDDMMMEKSVLHDNVIQLTTFTLHNIILSSIKFKFFQFKKARPQHVHNKLTEQKVKKIEIKRHETRSG